MKRAPLMTQPTMKSPKNSFTEQKQISRGKQKQNKKLKQESKNLSPTIKKKHQILESKSAQKLQVKRQLFPIPQFIQAPIHQLLNNKIQIPHFAEVKNQQKHPQYEKSQEKEERSPSFERTSVKLSQKRYNVSLASAKSSRDRQLSRNSSLISKSKKQSNKSEISQQKKNNSKSPFNIIQSAQEAEKWIQLTLKKVKNESIKMINEEFTKNIEQPLKIQSQISKSTAQTQRCLKHNTPYSLYCSIDRQLLCVGCIYSQKSHKSHQVLPLLKSEKEMKEDIQSFKNRIDETMLQSESLIRQASLNLIKIQKHYPQILTKIQTYYDSIHQMIEQKKKQQLQYVQSVREQYKAQIKVIGQILNKFNNIFLEKLKLISYETKIVQNNLKKMQLSQRNELQKFQMPIKQISMQLTLKTRCSYETLSRYHKILQKYGDHLFDQRNKFDVRIQNFQQVLDLIKYKLAIVIPIMKRDPNNKDFSDFLSADDGTHLFGANDKNQKDGENKVIKKEKVSPSKKNEDKSLIHKKEFSMSPQVPKGLSRRFL